MYLGGSYHNHKSSERPIRTALEARSIATAVISAKMRQHISIETVSNAGYSSHAASAEFRISNIQGSPENPVNAGFFASLLESPASKFCSVKRLFHSEL